MRKERIEEITLLRAMAFLAIVLQHSIGEYIYRQDILPQDATMLGMLFHFTRYGTLTFVFLSAMIMFYKYEEDKLSYGPFMKKRFTDIFVPFMCWTFVYTWLILGPPWNGAGRFVTEYGQQLLSPTYGYQLWFVVMIFQFYLLFPAILWVARKVKDEFLRRWGERPKALSVRVGMLMLGCAVLYAGLLWLSYYRLFDISRGMTGVWKWLIDHRTLLLLFYWFYVALGAVCAFGLQRWRSFIEKSFALNLLLFVVLYIWLGYELLSNSSGNFTLQPSTYLRPITFMLIVPNLFVMYAIALHIQRIGGVMLKVMRWIGTYSFGGFLAHALVLSMVAQLTRPLQGGGYHLWMTAATFVVVAAGSLGLTKLISMLPFGRWIVGSTGKRRKGAAAGGSSGRAVTRAQSTRSAN